MKLSRGRAIPVLGMFPAAAAAESLRSCPTLCDPTDGSPPGSAVPGVLQARVLEWGAVAFSRYTLRKPQFKKTCTTAIYNSQESHPWHMPRVSQGESQCTEKLVYLNKISFFLRAGPSKLATPAVLTLLQNFTYFLFLAGLLVS